MSPVPLFDAHCDTVMKVLDQGVDFLSEASEAHISLPRMLAANVRAQVFACFVLGERYPDRASERAEEMIGAIEGMVASSSGRMAKVVDRSSLADAFSGGPIGALIGSARGEGGEPEALLRPWRARSYLRLEGQPVLRDGVRGGPAAQPGGGEAPRPRRGARGDGRCLPSVGLSVSGRSQ